MEPIDSTSRRQGRVGSAGWDTLAADAADGAPELFRAGANLSLAELLLVDKSKSAPSKVQVQLSVLAAGVSDGVSKHGVQHLVDDPLGCSLSFAGGAALGVALNAAPKWISMPAAMLGGMSVLKLGESAVKGMGVTMNALQQERSRLEACAPAGGELDAAAAASSSARATIAEALGPVVVESLSMLAGAGVVCGAGRMLSRRAVAVPEKAAAPIEKLEIPALRMSAELSYKDPSYFFPQLTKEAIAEFLNAPMSKTKLRAQFVRYTIDTLGNDKLTINGVRVNHLRHDLGEDFVKMPVMERQYRRIMLSTRHKDDPLAKLYNDVRESVVKVDASNGHKPEDSWTGSGAFVDKEGTIATALHAILDSTKLSVRTASGESYPAKIVGKDLDTDTALLKIDVPGKQFKPLSLSKQRLADGEKIFVFGHPAGNDNMFVSPGFFHRAEPTVRTVKRGYEDVHTGRIYPEEVYFAYTRPGNSGGPVVNGRGEIVAVHTSAKMFDNWDESYGASATVLRDLLKSSRSAATEVDLPISLNSLTAPKKLT